jgi:hypothetical protein
MHSCSSPASTSTCRNASLPSWNVRPYEPSRLAQGQREQRDVEAFSRGAHSLIGRVHDNVLREKCNGTEWLMRENPFNIQSERVWRHPFGRASPLRDVPLWKDSYISNNFPNYIIRLIDH